MIKRKSRPIAWNTVWTLWTVTSINLYYGKPDIGNYASGIKGGVEAALFHSNALLNDDPANATVAIGEDVKNAYGEVSRFKAIEAALNNEKLKHLWGVISFIYSLISHSYVVHAPTSSAPVVYRYNRGGSQGCPVFTIIFCAYLKTHLPETTELGGFYVEVEQGLIPYADNILFIYANASAALEMHMEWRRSLPPDIRMATEFTLWPRRGDPPKELLSLTAILDPTDGLKIG